MKHAICALLAFALVCLAFPSTSSAWPFKSREEKATEVIGKYLNQNKQAYFNEFHPVGTAKKIEVHEFQYLPGQNAATVRFTIFWQSPLISSGFTKVQANLDLENGSWTNARIIATNGMTNEQAVQAFKEGFNIGWRIGERLDN